MEGIIESPLRLYPSGVLLAAGTLITAVGLRRWWRTVRMPAADPGKSLAMMQAFRVWVFGLAACGLGVAWMGQILWLAVLSLAVGGEELFESTMAIGAMRYGKRRAARA